ncbi:hypothetical protein BX616_001731, partial [Lobosporangium transversale]
MVPMIRVSPTTAETAASIAPSPVALMDQSTTQVEPATTVPPYVAINPTPDLLLAIPAMKARTMTGLM